MKEPTVRVRAVVSLTVEVDVSDVWGGDCAMSQVSKQARESALALLTHKPMQELAAKRIEEILRRTRIVGVPLIKAIAVEEER